MNIIVPKFDTRLNRCMIIVRCTESFIDKKSHVNDLGPSHFIMPELYSDFVSKEWCGLGVFKVSSVQSIFRSLELVQHEQRPQHVFRPNFDL